MHPTTFDYLKPTPQQLHTMEGVRGAYKALFDLVEQAVPPGRYKALAISALEESAMWANKGITRDSDGTPRP